MKLRKDLSPDEQEIAQLKVSLEETKEHRFGFSKQLKVRLQALQRKDNNSANWLDHFTTITSYTTNLLLFSNQSISTIEKEGIKFYVTET